MSDRQQLNSVERFRKQPGRLVLEAFSNCEVPAGCGGVVLRWRNPNAALPVTIHLYTPVASTISWMDGRPVPTGRVDLAPGPHAFALVIENVDLSAGLLLFAALFVPQERQRAPGAVSEQPVKVLSADDGTWKFTLSAPDGAAWHLPSFDDRDWPALVSVPPPQLAVGDFGAYQGRHCLHQGAVCLGLPTAPTEQERPSWWQRLWGRSGPASAEQQTEATGSPESKRGTLWVRKMFVIAPPEYQDTPS